ncbi:hypothetical protein D1610_15165 [Sphingomonas gilva]|uniref:Uncharacterized protein n=1 Tax=Sphingomonas gilva TaxID=2305907 RepID=A0A396RZB6_9SPHN|nr:hypothetical protein [Sphingomonas gilva]RHW16445.1 hypothetical protein D1610_15165 [Sphingomonas gilva]
MRAWLLLLGGLIVWAVHFFGLYIVASVFLTTDTARMLALLVTLACLIADAMLLAAAMRANRAADDGTRRWIASLAALGAAISLVAVIWQGLPALLV